MNFDKEIVPLNDTYYLSLQAHGLVEIVARAEGHTVDQIDYAHHRCSFPHFVKRYFPELPVPAISEMMTALDQSQGIRYAARH